MNRLSSLENKSIHILREAHYSFEKLGMLWSMGKDSTVLLWLARKAFFGPIPFPLIHIDTSFKLPEMISFRDRLARELGFELVVARNETSLRDKNTFPDGKLDRTACCHALKTTPLRELLAGRGARERLNHASGNFEPYLEATPFDGLIVGVRADEEGTRAKERHFSPRNADGSWGIHGQPPELWDQFATDHPPDTHVRVHPLLDWTEVDVWQYIAREGLEVVPAYFDQGKGERYRSLGCRTCSFPICSQAKNPEQIISELNGGSLTGVPERAGRKQDEEDGGGLQTLRVLGYM